MMEDQRMLIFLPGNLVKGCMIFRKLFARLVMLQAGYCEPGDKGKMIEWQNNV